MSNAFKSQIVSNINVLQRIIAKMSSLYIWYFVDAFQLSQPWKIMLIGIIVTYDIAIILLWGVVNIAL